MRDQAPSKKREWTPEDIVSVLDDRAGTAVTVKLEHRHRLIGYVHGELGTRADMPREVDHMRAQLAADASEGHYDFDPLALYHVGGAWLPVPRTADCIVIYDHGVLYSDSDEFCWVDVAVQWRLTEAEEAEIRERLAARQWAADRARPGWSTYVSTRSVGRVRVRRS